MMGEEMKCFMQWGNGKQRKRKQRSQDTLETCRECNRVLERGSIKIIER